jgi:hypothetical protein
MEKLKSFEPSKSAVSGEVTISQQRILMRFSWEDPLEIMQIPEREPELSRLHELWKSTCFEAFIQPEGLESYLELNLTPAGRWNAYSFQSYRNPQPVKEALEVRLVRMLGSQNQIEGEFSFIPKNQRFNCGLSAVIENQGGKIEYFSLAHLAAKPDFHDAKAFLTKRSFL